MVVFDRFLKRSAARWAAAIGLASALALPGLPATAQPEVGSGPAETPADCVIRLSVANPSPGDQEVPRSVVMSGIAIDNTAPSGTGIRQVEAFVGNRDAGGTFLGRARFNDQPVGTWFFTATIPTEH